jgi:uncharacterized membrane-anchored protein
MVEEMLPARVWRALLLVFLVAIKVDWLVERPSRFSFYSLLTKS